MIRKGQTHPLADGSNADQFNALAASGRSTDEGGRPVEEIAGAATRVYGRTEMAPNEFEWGAGKVTHWGMEGVDPGRPFSDQADELREDLIQVQYSDNTVLDVGWYPESSVDGSFVVLVVRDQEWEEPLKRFEARSLEELRAAIALGVGAATG